MAKKNALARARSYSATVRRKADERVKKANTRVRNYMKQETPRAVRGAAMTQLGAVGAGLVIGAGLESTSGMPVSTIGAAALFGAGLMAKNTDLIHAASGMQAYNTTTLVIAQVESAMADK